MPGGQILADHYNALLRFFAVSVVLSLSLSWLAKLHKYNDYYNDYKYFTLLFTFYRN
jgi:hypothetical protein